MKFEKLNKPPNYLLLSLISMLILHYFLPVFRIFDTPQHKVAGAIIILLGFGGILWCANYFRIYETPIKPFEKPVFFIRRGPYKYSRNPIYLAMVLVLIGSVVFLGSFSTIIVIPIFIYLMLKNFILKEEENLEDAFGEEYLQYKKDARRWL